MNFDILFDPSHHKNRQNTKLIKALPKLRNKISLFNNTLKAKHFYISKSFLLVLNKPLFMA